MYDDSRVAMTETIQVKSLIRDDLNTEDREFLIGLPKHLSRIFGLAETQALDRHARTWIKHGQCNGLVDYLCTSIYDKEIEQLSRFGNNLKKLGVHLVDDSDSKLDESDSGCKWVPSAFSQADGRRAYRGVFLRPNLSPQNDRGFQGFQASTNKAGSSAGSSGSGSSGSGSSGICSSGSGSSGNGRGRPPDPPNPPKMTRKEINEKYSHGKGWPPTPIRSTGDYYFGKPGTCKFIC